MVGIDQRSFLEGLLLWPGMLLKIEFGIEVNFKRQKA